jgi:hypothetical protein
VLTITEQIRPPRHRAARPVPTEGTQS